MGTNRVIWRKSSYSGSNGGDCVEVAQFPASAVGVRDSKDPAGPKLLFSVEEWSTFVQGIKHGEFDLA
jgi:Domain of unknown function (DUF397)